MSYEPSDTAKSPTVTVGDTIFGLPYADLLPPLDDSDLSALRGDIAARQAVIVPIVIDEARNVIDGANRLRIAASLGIREVPVEVRLGLSAAEKEQLWENTAKVALIKAVSANPEAPVIRGEDASWARDVVAHCVATLLVQAERHLADNEHEANHKKVLRLIDAAGATGLSRTEFYRQSHFLGDRREAVLSALIQSEEVEETIVATKTKRRTTYRRKSVRESE